MYLFRLGFAEPFGCVSWFFFIKFRKIYAITPIIYSLFFLDFIHMQDFWYVAQITAALFIFPESFFSLCSSNYVLPVDLSLSQLTFLLASLIWAKDQKVLWVSKRNTYLRQLQVKISENLTQSVNLWVSEHLVMYNCCTQYSKEQSEM